MKASIISALAVASLATAAPVSSRQEQTASIELETEPDTFVQDDVPLDVVFSTAENPRLAEGISASVVSPDGVQCQAFDANQQPLGAPFGENATEFSDDPVTISAYICSDYFCRAGGNCGDVQEDDNVEYNVGQAQGQARIQLEISSDTFVQEEIPIGIDVSTQDHPRLDSGISVTLTSAEGVNNPDAVTCQTFQGGKPLGEQFGRGKIVDLAQDSDPVQIDAFRCDA